ncbi:MAG: site-specific integrase [bacterium]
MSRKTFKKITTSEEFIEKINPQNKKLIKLFIQDKNRKCSDATIKGYTSDLNIFFCWALNECENKFFPDIKKYELSNFFSYCIDELQWNGKRFARMRSVLSSLSECVIKYFDEEYPTFRNIINAVIEAVPKEAVREKTVLSDQDVQKLLDWLSEKNQADACLLALAVYSGSRISELEQFRIDTIDENNLSFGGLFLETTHKIRGKGFGKNGSQIYKHIIKDLFLPYYNNYLEYRKEIIENTKSESNMLFLQKDGVPATVTTFNSWKRKWEKYLKSDLYFHNYRHFFTTMLVKQKMSKEVIMAIVSWKSDIVGIYDDTEEKNRDWSNDLEKLSLLLDNKKGDE